MDMYGMPHNLHLFLDTDNSPASAVCAILFKVKAQTEQRGGRVRLTTEVVRVITVREG